MENVIQNKFLEIPKSALVASCLVHLSVPVLFVFVQVLDSMGISIFPKRDIHKQIYQQFIQVDIVDLPDNLFRDKGAVDAGLPIVEKPKVELEAAKHDEKDVLQEEETKADKAKTAAQTKKEMLAEARAKEKQRKHELEDALKKAAEEAKKERALKDLVAKAGSTGRKKIAGNVLSKGTASTGAIGTAKEQYTSRLVENIRQHFQIYPWQQKKGLMGVIQIELFPTGRLRSRKILKASGDSTFDSALLQAVDAAQPFPIPEDSSLLAEEFAITFIP